MVVGTCATSWFFGENSVGRSTAREEGKRKAKNATELATGDTLQGHRLFTTQGARADKMESMKNVNLPVSSRHNSRLSFCVYLDPD